MSGGGTPRQKMINLMYLVLLALLAMNISKEVLNSFALVNNGLVKTNKSFAAKNDATYNQFEIAMLDDAVKVRPYYDKAKGVRKRSQEMFDYIETLKRDLIKEVENAETITIETQNGKDTIVPIINDLVQMQSKEDNATPTRYFMATPSGSVGDAAAEPGSRAYDLKEKIKNYKKDLITYIDPKDRPNIRLGLDIGDVFNHHENKNVTWENNIFYHNASIAVMCLLTKMQNDVKNAESDIINALLNRINAKSFKFDTLASRVIAKSNYVVIGDDYNADVFLAGFSTTSNPQIWVGDVDTVTNTIKGHIDSTSVKVSNGVGHYITSPSAQGTVEWGGLIRVKDPVDPTIIRSYPFKSEYKAAPPAVTVSPDKMNVFYIGIDNPVSISAAGFAAEDLVPSLAGGSISGGKGKYNVRVNKTASGKCMVNVSVKTKTGMKPMGKGTEFRVKPVPNPVPEFMGKRGSDVVSQAQLKGASGVLAKLDNFEFDLKFPVVSFNVSMTVNGQVIDSPTNGSALSQQQLSLLAKAKKGMKVYIENVKVKKPDGAVVDIGGVGLKVL